MALLHATDDVLNVASITSKLTETENEYRHSILRHFIDTKSTYKPRNLSEETLMESLQARNVLNSSIEASAVYPLSAHCTNKKVTLLNDGRNCNAMCAVDALGCYYTFKQPVKIESACEETSVPLTLIVNDKGDVSVEGANKEDIRVLTHDLNHSDTWSSCCCTVMHFFKDQASLESWHKKNVCCCKDAFWMTLDEAFLLAKNLFEEC